jgi:hypothetical protein
MALAGGDYVARFEPRTLDHIRALGGNDLQDERSFATVARVSEINYGLYRNFVAPWLRPLGSEAMAQTMRQLSPMRLQYELASDKNPLMLGVAALAEQVRRDRRPAAPDNPFLQWQAAISQQIVAALDGWRDIRDQFYEQTFHAVYGSPVLQAAVGLAASDEPARQRASKDPHYRWFVDRRIEELHASMAEGGLREAAIRAMLYIGLAEGAADERGFAVLRQIRAEQSERRPLAEFKQTLREQFFMLLVDEERALAAIPSMLSQERERIPELIAALRRIMAAVGTATAERTKRLARVESLLQDAATAPVKPIISVKRAPTAETDPGKRIRPSREPAETVKT